MNIFIFTQGGFILFFPFPLKETFGGRLEVPYKVHVISFQWKETYLISFKKKHT